MDANKLNNETAELYSVEFHNVRKHFGDKVPEPLIAIISLLRLSWAELYLANRDREEECEDTKPEKPDVGDPLTRPAKRPHSFFKTTPTDIPFKHKHDGEKK